MRMELFFGIIFFAAGAACLFGANEMCAFAASRSLWTWQRQIARFSGNVNLVRLVGAIAMIYSAFIIWSRYDCHN
jgi:hypothetical protein